MSVCECMFVYVSVCECVCVNRAVAPAPLFQAWLLFIRSGTHRPPDCVSIEMVCFYGNSVSDCVSMDIDRKSVV